MTSDPNVAGALRMQSEVCRQLGSPFNAAMLAHMAADYESGGPVGELVQPWRGASIRTLFDDAVPIRLVNAFTHLAQSGDAPDLAAVYPHDGAPGDPDAAWRIGRANIATRREHLAGFMRHEPQTNEVRRSGVLLGGFLTIAEETRLPLRCFEIGASAGLNMLWDRFRYSLGEAAWGDPASPVHVPVAWEGALPPLDARIEVAERAACDRRPTDLDDPAERRRLMACIWPDQFDRIERSRAASAMFRAEGLHVAAADALDWVRAEVRPKAGAATTLYHSIFWQYLPAATREGLLEAIADIGAKATPDAPFAWLRMEPRPEDLATVELRLTLWPGGADRRLAEVHPHGAWAKWGGAPAD